MILEPIVENDLQSLRELQPEGWPNIVPVYDYYLKMPFCTPLKVMLEKRIAGVGTGISWGKTAWLGHIIVAPEYRKRGIGGFIVGQLVNILESSGCQTISLIATELGYPVYQKAGFIEQTEYVFFEREAPLNANCLSENIVRLTTKNPTEIITLDKKVSGEDRSALLVDKIANCHIYRVNGKTFGYYLPELGEGLIVAENKTAGIELMKLKYSVSTKGALPIENKEGIAFFKENGFVETKKAKRMVWGEEFSWRPEQIYSRIGGNLG